MESAKADAVAIRRILHQDWDPIGCGVPEDEYDSYLWPVLGLLQDGASRGEVERYLREAADVAMSSPVPEARLAMVIDKLFGLEIGERKTPPGQ